jgi:hypothetical protein
MHVCACVCVCVFVCGHMCAHVCACVCVRAPARARVSTQKTHTGVGLGGALERACNVWGLKLLVYEALSY